MSLNAGCGRGVYRDAGAMRADEAHKALSPGRHCSWDEVELNVLGAFLSAGTVLIVGALRARRGK